MNIKSKRRAAIFAAIIVSLLTVMLFAFTAEGASTVVSPKPKSKAERGLLTTSEYSYRVEDDYFGVRAAYKVDVEALATLEESYYVTFGAMVGRYDNGLSTNNMVLEEEGDTFVAPDGASMITVYSTDGRKSVNGRFTSEDKDEFALTVNLGEMTSERCESQFVFVGFIILEDKAGEDETRVLYVTRSGSPYGNYPSYNGFYEYAYLENKGGIAMDAYIALLQDEMKADVAALQSARVLVCGEDSASVLADGEKAIWVEYLPELNPYKTGDADKKAIRAAYLYYPLSFDPSAFEDYDLADMGVVRTFVYIGMPQNQASLPGLVCVHGGGGHAYAQYALEAVRYGYASIAIDTEGYRNTSKNGAYTGAEATYEKDGLGHLSKDSFNNAEGPLSGQWLYYAVCDTVMANTVLRSFSTVDEDSVGVTGISWGGLITSTTICYDMRFAFCAPIYISFHMSESKGLSLADLPNKPFADKLWQNSELFSKSTVPTMIITGEKDSFASVDTVSASAADLPNGTLLYKHGLTHGQQQGASLPEIYYFGNYILGKNDGFVKPTVAPTKEMGKNYTMKLAIPEGLTDVKATLCYRTSPIPSYNTTNEAQKPQFATQELTVAADGTVYVTVPSDACMYFITFSGYSEEVAAIKNNADKPLPYASSDPFPKGYVYSSTDLIVLK